MSRTAVAVTGAPQVLTVESTGGARLHTEILGPKDAPAVVLSHGWTCNTAFWEPVVRRLAGDHRVVRYDQRGHGRSPATPGACSTEALADDLCAVLAATVPAARRAVIGGHSMGGMTIVAAAGRPEFEERAAAAMLCSTGMGGLTTEARVAPVTSPPRLRTLMQRAFLTSSLPMGPVTPVSRRVLHYVTMGPGAGPELRADVARMVAACPRRVRGEWGRVLAGLSLMDRLPRLTVPAVVVHGTRDRLTPRVHAHRMARALPDCEGPVLLDGLGHMTPLEDPDRIAGILRELARRHLAPPDPGEPDGTQHGTQHGEVG
ncbi:alpha/beta fold hydrolase [Streptomyces aidingensis]|uniref:Pimeloyl-ACP methyl ester carboxylesterase n=1 Tax=Streptomyces aidingensis TaxID=910347 RepID=A0A1I1GXF6_9ACTN|nr:alpha/beta hydrolase [Streptomyces aidingensis]SFC16156.1 Pimeloyl-ACP methyl ester carboxylesterase [Streptomyces aidingensis]